MTGEQEEQSANRKTLGPWRQQIIIQPYTGWSAEPPDCLPSWAPPQEKVYKTRTRIPQAETSTTELVRNWNELNPSETRRILILGYLCSYLLFRRAFSKLLLWKQELFLRLCRNGNRLRTSAALRRWTSQNEKSKWTETDVGLHTGSWFSVLEAGFWTPGPENKRKGFSEWDNICPTTQSSAVKCNVCR